MRIASPKDFGVVVRSRRKELGYSQEKLADLAGVSRKWISEVERGKPAAEIGLVITVFGVLGLALTTTDVDYAQARNDLVRLLEELDPK